MNTACNVVPFTDCCSINSSLVGTDACYRGDRFPGQAAPFHQRCRHGHVTWAITDSKEQTRSCRADRKVSGGNWKAECVCLPRWLGSCAPVTSWSWARLPRGEREQTRLTGTREKHYSQLMTQSERQCTQNLVILLTFIFLFLPFDWLWACRPNAMLCVEC